MHYPKRKLGDGYSLALKVSEHHHLTLVYFNKLKRGYEQNLVKTMCNEYFCSNNILSVPLHIGEKFGTRSVCITGQIEKITEDLSNLFSGFNITKDQIPHIDLRGHPVSSLPECVNTIDNFYV